MSDELKWFGTTASGYKTRLVWCGVNSRGEDFYVWEGKEQMNFLTRQVWPELKSFWED